MKTKPTKTRPMKSQLIALTLVTLTALAVGLYPGLQRAATEAPASAVPPAATPVAHTPASGTPAAGDPQVAALPEGLTVTRPEILPETLPETARPRIEVAFVLDTTGSMSGLIQAAKEKIWSIAATMAAGQPAPEIRMGLVAYRDRGDDYVTRVLDLSSDIDGMVATLMDFEAGGGGDGPESVNQALQEAVEKLSWSQDEGTYRVLFLVGDAPPHMDYQDDVKWPVTLAAARARGIRVNTIQCGRHPGTAREWQAIAGLGEGSFFEVEQAGGAVAIATPYDAPLAALSAELDETRLSYGDAEDKEREAHKREATEKLEATASVAAKARRATFHATASGKSNLLGEKDLVEAVTSGRVALDEIAPEELPAPMQSLAPAAQEALIAKTAQRRHELTRQVEELADKRAAYLRDQVEASGGAAHSLDHGIFRAVREQAAAAGLTYDAAEPAY